MPYGFEQYRLAKGISPQTTIIEVGLIKSLLAFINKENKRSVELFEIRQSDIRNFLQDQKKQGLADTTILRKLSTIKQFFSYLWETNLVPVDIMTKFKYDNLDKVSTKINVNYQYLLSQKSKVLHSPKLRLYAKMLYLLYMRGIRVRDIVKITLDDLEDLGDSIIFEIKKSNDCIQKATFTDMEIPTIMASVEKANLRGTPYLLSSKIDGEYVPLQLGSFKDYIISLKEVLGTPFRSEQIRLAYAHYLYTHKQKKLEDLQEILGVSLTTASVTIKETLERVEEVNYT